MEYQLVLVDKIHEFEAKGWRLATGRIACQLGGWHSVYMVRDIST